MNPQYVANPPWHSGLAGMRIVLLLLLVWVGGSSINAKAGEENLLPFQQGSFETLQSKHANKNLVLSFWSINCVACGKDMPLWRKLVDQYKNRVSVILVATDSYEDSESIFAMLNMYNLEDVENWVFADAFVERLRFEVSPRWRGELPLTFLKRKDGKSLLVPGVIEEADLLKWFGFSSN